MAVTRPRSGLYNWRRFTKPSSSWAKRKFDADNVDHWIKQVEKASEYAVSEVFSSKKKPYSPGLYGPVLDLETVEQLHDHDEAYIEAQELLSDWMNSKLKLELASDQDDDNENHAVLPVTSSVPSVAFQKYERFDDFCSYLEQDMENTTVQEFLQHLLQSEVVENGVLEDLRIDYHKKKMKPRDPRITMELRHKLVKENRLKRQKQQELLKQEKALKKSAMAEAQKQLQEENKMKALKARKEEEEIQKEMVKLRKELVERRHLLEESRKMERKSHNLKERERLKEFGLKAAMSTNQNCKEEREKREKQIKIQELLEKTDIANQKSLQKYFSAWYKLILDLRIKMGKARALADWKCQMKFLRAWRDYTWSQKLEQETLKLESQLQDQNRKKHLASEFYRKCILRRYFVEWQCWSHTEVEKREIHLKKEEARKKMAKLLEEVALGKYAKDCSRDARSIHKTEEPWAQSVNDKEVAKIPSLQEDSTTAKRERTNVCSPEAGQKCSLHLPKKPKWAWQITPKHAALNEEDRAVFCNQARNSTQHHGMHNQKTDLAFGGPLERYHVLQQQLIEEQRQQLKEQQELILQLKEKERLKTVMEQAKEATVTTMQLTSQIPKPKEEEQLRENQMAGKNKEPSRLGNDRLVVQSKKNLKVLPTTHPLLQAMEERALQRAERKRELEEAKRKREEEKLAQMQAEQEERQRQEEAQKEAQLQKKREEKRLQKMKELEKQKKLERVQQLLSIAREHYKTSLLRKKGLEPWKRLIQQTRENVSLAERHYCFKLQRKCLLVWLHHTQEMLTAKIVQAEELYSCLLLRKSFKIWREYKNYTSSLEEKAKNIHDTALKKKVFWAWFDVVNEEKSVSWEKQKIADQHSSRRIIQTAFRTWRQIPALMKEERKKKERIEQLRKRVAEILPDFRV